MTDYFQTDDELRELVASFEACRFHPSEFRHYQHLAVALWYVWHLPYEQAAHRMTTGIHRLAETFGKTGYHETITLFWLQIVSDFAASDDRNESLAMTANKLVRRYENKNLIYDYYSADLIASAKAKAEWVDPDLKTMP